ncbi:NAD(P)H-binding protein [Mycobacterium shinjukuense]|uniref:NAD(P)-binding domain-containing protein n=1 Tax=Mycobacterium shinjukuense TaxID=398694 RepID=A0A7I7MT89_9MYCO|nr:NAD(P)H-binding protein [Mycobacterium shinjukuense]BBX75498.1 hypothetical protein MSHI_34040 [Mycobacterium shinjukuense]
MAGASGHVGGQLLRLLLADPTWDRVHTLVRRPGGSEEAKLVEHVVDFDDLDPHIGLFAGADVFCCLGTTMAKAGSREAFRKVDHGYVVKLAQLASDGQARQFLLVTAIGASARSPSFYSRVKAEAERAVSAMTLPTVHIFRPSLLLGSRAEGRRAEDLGKVLVPLVSPVMVGPLARYRPVHPDAVARRMVQAAKAQQAGVHIHYPSD